MPRSQGPKSQVPEICLDQQADGQEIEMDVCQCRIGNESPARTERHELIVDRVERDGSEAVSLSRITRNRMGKATVRGLDLILPASVWSLDEQNSKRLEL